MSGYYLLAVVVDSPDFHGEYRVVLILEDGSTIELSGDKPFKTLLNLLHNAVDTVGEIASIRRLDATPAFEITDCV